MNNDLSTECLSKIADLNRWIVKAGNSGRSERGLTHGLATRLVRLGIPVDRISMGSDVLDPVIQARSYIWHSDRGAEPFQFERGLRRSDNWLRSTLYHMIQRDEIRFRLKLDSPSVETFSLLPTLRDEGFTDYYARLEAYGDRTQSAGMRGLMASFASKHAGGYTEDHLAIFDAILPTFALAFLARLNARMMQRALETYLGKSPAQRVLSGDIARGEAQTMDAVIWMSDLAGFTRMADRLPRESILEFLNAHAELVTEAVETHGGEVLKFIGDGILAVFPCKEEIGRSATCALDAAIRVELKSRDLIKARWDEKKPAADIMIALHRGEVLFGNFGSADRLDFTAVGPAVNETSRLLSLAKTLEQRVIVSDDLRSAIDADDRRLVSVGRYALRGVNEPKDLFTLDRSVVTI